MKKNYLHLTFLFLFAFINFSKAQTVLLYQNNFETPLQTPNANCGPDLDATQVNTLWGGTGLGTGGGGSFQQVNTVETILIHGPDNQYTDSTGIGGDYCLSMLSILQDDKASLTLNSQMLPFANITFNLSAIDLPACGGNFGLDTAVMRITVYDSPNGIFNIFSPGVQLDEDTVTGIGAGPTSYTFNWASCATSLHIDSSVDGNITIVFDLLRSGYAAFDNLSISSSTAAIGMEEHNPFNQLITYPNPAGDYLKIKCDGLNNNSSLNIFNTVGQLMQKTNFNGNLSIDIDKWEKGIYVLQFSTGNFITYKRIVKS